ncbi:hypothetical protein [Actinokineospora spheciospongiae]|uniref:hypothetical protein n=1 Tax=Actinokineospora spheciospongiae TaxID=909613 RepID=UPI0015E87291|nr:hypothetical protein [Actinokineospora spheciospongiae]
MPRKTRRRLVGGKREDAEQREREQALRELEAELRREARSPGSSSEVEGYRSVLLFER